MICELIKKIFSKANEPDKIQDVTVSEQNIENYDWLVKQIHDYSVSILLGKSRAVNIIGIHCYETEGDDILNLDDAELFFKRKFGKKNVYTNGYIPYHFIITKDGSVLEAVPLSAPALGFSGHLNDGISICCIGSVSKTEEQEKSIDWLVSILKDRLGVRTVINT